MSLRRMIQCGRSVLVKTFFLLRASISTITNGLEFLPRIVPLFCDIAYVHHGETLPYGNSDQRLGLFVSSKVCSFQVIILLPRFLFFILFSSIMDAIRL